MIRRLILTTAACGIVLATGCKKDCCLNDPNQRPNPYRPPAPNSPYLLPPAGLPTTPPPGGSSIVPGAGPMNSPNYPQPDFSPPPSNKPPPEVLFPDPLPGGPSSRPMSSSDSGVGVFGPPVRPTAEPPVAANPMTVGLPGFTKVKDGFASGGKPSLDGFDSLRQAGYRTVIYLHAANVDVSASKEVAEKRQLKFIAIETTPEKLADAITQFNAAVADKANRSAYVYDDDGIRAGAVWYLHFRTAEARNDDEARIRAKPLGLTDQGEEAKTFWIAIRAYLEKR
jgi:protein tyrosine phosphatase (PTP) superfamily phosphohydrolase (DUF442 family)